MGEMEDQKEIEKSKKLFQQEFKHTLYFILCLWLFMAGIMLLGAKPTSLFWWIGIPIGLVIEGLITIFLDRGKKLAVFYQCSAIIAIAGAFFLGHRIPQEIRPVFNGVVWGLCLWYFFYAYKKGLLKDFLNTWHLARKKSIKGS